MTVYALVIDEIIDTISIPFASGYIEVPDDTFPGDAYYNGMVIHKPSQYYVYDISIHDFVLDQDLFTPALEDAISSYRDLQTNVAVSYNNGTATYNVNNDDRTRSALQQKATALQLNSSATTYNFSTNDGFFDLTVSDIQGLFLACDTRQQKCFNAQQSVLAQHAITPYTSIDDAKADFDTFLAS